MKLKPPYSTVTKPVTLRYKTMFYKGFIERIGRFRYALQNPLAARPRLAIKTYELGYIF